MTSTDNVREKLLGTFNDQFATNQNHGQSIFIQFLSAILAILIGYGYIYANTAATADFWFVTHDPKLSKDITSYALMHLFAALFISELILTLLATVVLNIGYGFRRDQLVIFRMRKRTFGADYVNFFGTRSFDPSGQNFWDYLPEFNRMFFLGIFLLQASLLTSFFIALKHAEAWKNPCGFWHMCFYIGCAFPWLWTTWLYSNYYKKYYWVMSDTDLKWWNISKAERTKKIGTL